MFAAFIVRVVSSILCIASLCEALPQTILEDSNNNNSVTDTNPANRQQFLFENIVLSGIRAARFGRDPPILYISARSFRSSQYSADNRSMRIAIDGPGPGKHSTIVNKAPQSPLEWWQPDIVQDPTVTTTGQFANAATFRWSTLRMTLSEAIEIARQAGFPPPWQKVGIAYITNQNIFDQPGPNEIVFDLGRNVAVRENVAVGSMSRRVKHLQHSTDFLVNGNPTGDRFQAS